MAQQSLLNCFHDFESGIATRQAVAAVVGDLTVPISGSIGVEVHGLDVLRLDDDGIEELRRLWAENLVVVFKRQDHLSPGDLEAFAARFGPVYRHPLMALEQSAVHAINIPAGGYWHSDATFDFEPPAATMLHAQVVPERGGDTLWTNMHRAYETLSPPVQRFLDGLQAVHDFDHFYRYPRREGVETDQFILDRKKERPLPQHPVVRTHPVTGRKALYVNPIYTTKIVGLSKDESRAVLDLLFAHCTRPELTCRHRWEAGDICFWDNRSTMHYPVDDWGGSLADSEFSARKMNRVTIAGERPQ